jgi:hypothetical protein
MENGSFRTSRALENSSRTLLDELARWTDPLRVSRVIERLTAIYGGRDLGRAARRGPAAAGPAFLAAG